MNEKEMYELIIKLLQEKVDALEAEKKELERKLLYENPWEIKPYVPSYPINPWNPDPAIPYPWTQPIYSPNTGMPPQEWETTTSTTAKVSDCINNTVTHSVVNPTKIDYTVSVYAESDKIATYDPKTKKLQSF